MSGSEDPPVLRVVSGGEPTPEELAALVVVLSARRPAAHRPVPTRSAWLSRGPDAWRWSLR